MIKRPITITVLSLFALWAAACGSNKDKGSAVSGGTNNNGNAGTAGTTTGGEVMFGTPGSGGGSVAPGGTVGNADTDASCGGTNLVAAPVPINLLVVLDRSGSMDTTPQGFALNKWDAIRQALQGALEATQDRLITGLELFPHNPTTEIPADCGDPNTCCSMPGRYTDAIVVPLAPGADAVPDIVSALGGESPGGGTPTATALDLALGYFGTSAVKALTGKKYVLLATDGGPNCNPDISCDAQNCTANIDYSLPFTTNQCSAANTGPSFCIDSDRTVANAAALAAAGVKTIVVGIPGTEAYASILDQVAIAGEAPNTTGASKYYAVTSSGGVMGLENTLRDITTQLITTCELQLESVPPDPTKVNVKIDGEFIPFLNGAAPAPSAADAGDAAAGDAGSGASTGDGWTLDQTTSPPTVVLQGAPCDSMRQNGAQNVQIVFGCPRIEVNIR